MKKAVLTSIFIASLSAAHAQAVLDTVSMGAQYANNVWYSLENDEVGTQPVGNWEIALAATSSQTSSLTTALHINSKVVKLYEAAGVPVADFSTVTTFDNTWTELYNTDTTWSIGAFNTTTPMNQFDYGWGSYNTTTHNVEANRVFVLEYVGTTPTYRKMYVTLNTMAGTYTLVHANLDNSDMHTETLDFSPYTDKNFFYFTLTGNAIVDREPETDNWDLLFTQYAAYIPTPYFPVTGILHNVDVEVIKAQQVADVTTFVNYGAHTFDYKINGIGYNWKTLNNQTFTYNIEDSTVYFVKVANGDIWKMIMTGFGGSSNGSSMFSKEKLLTASVHTVQGASESSLAVYPNPSTAATAQIVYHLGSNNRSVVLSVLDVTGKVVATAALDNTKGLHQQAIPGADRLLPGMYLVHVSTDKGSMQQKLIIQ
ncbi:MAG: T9SS type A sorting domain-containing protein [Flavipsychrobacter sp.]|nr:T9SS type A sorting domain-containing protein [Flavipsychrobacter sp.]